MVLVCKLFIHIRKCFVDSVKEYDIINFSISR